MTATPTIVVFIAMQHMCDIACFATQISNTNGIGVATQSP